MVAMEGSGSSPPPSRREEVFLPLPVPRAQLAPTTEFRSTWLVSSQNAIRQRRRYDDYLAKLPDRHRETLETLVVGSWVPIDVAIAHYEACDALGFMAQEQIDIGRDVTKTLNNTLLSTALRLVTTSATLWTTLAQMNRLWERMFVGGGVQVWKLGPKECRVELLGCRLAHIPYFRAGLQGVFIGIASHLTTKVYVNEVPRLNGPTTIVYRGSWV